MEKIFIEDGLSLYNKTGIGQYTENLVGLLLELGYKVIMPRKYFLEKIKNATIKRILYVLWLNLIFPILFIFSGAEKAIFTNYLTPLYRIPAKKYYPVIHDLWVAKFPELMSKTKRNYQNWILNVTKKNYYKIITVSETVKYEIIDYYKCLPDDICVIYNYFSFGEHPSIKLSDTEQTNILKRYSINKKEYILSVGSLNKRKNIQILIDSYKQIDTNFKLVVVGQRENQEFIGINDNIIFTGYIDEELLKVLYTNALLFVFPSLYEGFGIPIIDAQSFGVPVLCSDISIFHEISNESALFCKTDIISIKEGLIHLLDNYDLQQELINKGYENVKRYYKDSIKNEIGSVLED